MSVESLKPEFEAKIQDLIGVRAPATDALVHALAEAVRDVREHQHPAAAAAEDIYCGNLCGWMGERMGSVLARLVAVEEELGRLRVELEGGDFVVEYGVRAQGKVMALTADLADCEARAGRYRDCWPDAVVVFRTGLFDEWTPVEAGDQ